METLDSENDPHAPDSSERNVALFAHLSPLLMFLIPIPFTNILAPLVLYLVKKDQSAFIRRHAAAAVNFQIAYSIVLIGVVVVLFAIATTMRNADSLLLTWLFSVLGAFVAIVICLVFLILNAVRASNGQEPNYPIEPKIVR